MRQYPQQMILTAMMPRRCGAQSLTIREVVQHVRRVRIDLISAARQGVVPDPQEKTEEGRE